MNLALNHGRTDNIVQILVSNLVWFFNPKKSSVCSTKQTPSKCITIQHFPLGFHNLPIEKRMWWWLNRQVTCVQSARWWWISSAKRMCVDSLTNQGIDYLDHCFLNWVYPNLDYFILINPSDLFGTSYLIPWMKLWVVMCHLLIS